MDLGNCIVNAPFPAGELICEVPLEETFASIREWREAGEDFAEIQVRGEKYTINVRNNRYETLDRQRSCVCCGIMATRMFLGRFNHEGIIGYNFRIFAETRDKPEIPSHLTLMTKDHIVPRNAGGADDLDNLQTMCVLCNNLKEVMGLSLEQIQRSIFQCYRIYRGTLTLRKTMQNLQSFERMGEGYRKTIEAIENNLMKAPPEKRPGMIAKRDQAKEEIALIDRSFQIVLRRAQIDGKEYGISDLQETIDYLKRDFV